MIEASRSHWIAVAMGTALVVGSLVACARKSEDTVLARVGDEVITEADFEAFLEQIPAQWRARARTPSGRRQLLEHLVRSKLIELEARERGITERPQIRFRIEQQRQRILAEALLREWEKNFKLPDEELRAYYEQHRDRFRRPEQYRVQHILIKAPKNDKAASARAYERIREAYRRIKAGEPFDAVAREISEDPSASRGGDLGYIERGRFERSFETAALKLEKGQVSEPVRTPMGWHLIKLIDVKPAEELPFEDPRVREQIRRQLLPQRKQQAFEAFMRELRQRHRVEIHEEALRRKPKATAGKEKRPKPKVRIRVGEPQPATQTAR